MARDTPNLLYLVYTYMQPCIFSLTGTGTPPKMVLRFITRHAALSSAHSTSQLRFYENATHLNAGRSLDNAKRRLQTTKLNEKTTDGQKVQAEKRWKLVKSKIIYIAVY